MTATGTGNDPLSAPAGHAAEETAATMSSSPGWTPMIKARQMAAASVGLGAVTIWSALLGLITTPYLVRHLGPSRYGVFALITIMSAYLTNLEFGFGHAMGRFLARARAAGDVRGEDAVLSTSLAVFLAGATVAAGAAALGSGFLEDHFVNGPNDVKHEALGAIRLGAVALFLTFLTSFAATGLAAMGRFSIFLITRGVFGTLLSAGAIVAVALGGGLQSVIAVQVTVTACQCAILFTQLHRFAWAPLRPRIHGATFRAMGAFGVMVLLAGIAYQVVLQGPPTILAAKAATSDVAAFAVPSLVMQQLVTIATSTSLGFLSFASGESNAPDHTHLAAVFRSNIRMTLLVLGPAIAFLATFGHTLLSVWIGEGFADAAAAPLRFLALAGLLLALSAAPADVARALARPSWVTVYTAAGAVIAVGGSLLLVGDHGAAGVAAALFAALLLSTVPFTLVVSRLLLDTHTTVLASALARPLVAVAACAGLFLAGDALTSGIGPALAIGITVTVAYGAGVLRLVASDRERSVLRTMVRRGAPA